jgi:very-short-patch-repair endonuclease
MAPYAGNVSNIGAQYEGLRRKLVDTSLRNRMLNYRPSKRFGVEARGEDSTLVHQVLVLEGKRLSFQGVPDPRPGKSREPGLFDEPGRADALVVADANLGDPKDSSQSSPPDASGLADTRLDTGHTESQLARRLTLTQREATGLFEETGLNVLFLGLGALRWFETDGSDHELVAPLVFVPVRLVRTEGGRFRLEHDGGDVGDNLSLVVKAKDDLGLDLPRLKDDEDLGAFFRRLRKAVRSQSRWSVDTSFVVLGFFQFAKLIAYLDLDPRQWPKGASPLEHPDLVALLGNGYGPGYEGVGEDDPIDPHRPVGQCREVFDCDSSQSLAIVRALSGHSMVIQGPPGTGKSQTIANLVAEYLALGKRVLFVSEKMAALDVVYRRLDQAKLADACLELHSRASKRKAFYDELKRVLEVRDGLREAEAEVERLAKLRDELNSYCEECNAPLDPWAISPHDAMGHASALPPEDSEDVAHRLPFEAVAGLAWPALRGLLPQLADVQAFLTHMGPPAHHPWRGSGLRLVTPGDRSDIQQALESALACLRQAQDAAEALAGKLGAQPPATFAEGLILAECARRLYEAPPHEGVPVHLPEWTDQQERVNEGLAQVRRIQEIVRRRWQHVRGEAWSSDLSTALAAYRRLATKWWRALSGEYRAARRAVREAVTPAGPVTPLDQLALLEDLVEARALREAARASEPLLARLLGAQWQGEDSDVQALERLRDWVAGLHADVRGGRLPAGLLSLFSSGMDAGGLPALSRNAEEATGQALTAVRKVLLSLKMDETGIAESKVAQFAGRLDAWRSSLHRLGEIERLNAHCDELTRQGLGGVVPLVLSWPSAPQRLVVAVQRAYFEGVLGAALEQRPSLRLFDRDLHEGRIRQFREVELAILAYNRAKARVGHLRALPDVGLAVGNLAQLRRAMELRRAHKPIRWALDVAGEAVLRIKPVFLMSPLSVAQFLPRSNFRFDVVIFDEASQIKPEDALAAICRANQAIVVGDSQQMPPTSFFDRLTQNDDAEEDAPDVAAGRLGSVLELAAAACRGPGRSSGLRWHYRSVHPALIRTSNAAFYGNRLKVFPSPQTGVWDPHKHQGLRFHYDPTTAYDRGGTGKNVRQAQAVVQAALDHARSSPHASLGIAAFSQAQQEAILDLLEVERRNHPGVLERLDQAHPFEPLFVKNLENVQGDERDVIFISVGYGPDERGTVTMALGPIKQEGGERRLNVLMSRARMRCEVFTSLRADDVRLSDGSSRGLAVLRQFLRFAETGEMDDPAPAGREAESPFEAQVAAALRSRGYEVDAQVGSIGFFIDLAVRDPRRAGAYILGIECDGASYHSAKSARDRDRLRQDALEARGWRLHRIWSSDWWRNPAEELERCIQAIETARAVGGAPPPPAAAPRDEDVQFLDLNATAAPPPRQSVPYIRWSGALTLDADGYPRALECLVDVVTTEGPVHEGLALLRLRDAVGWKRAGSAIQAWFVDAVYRAQSSGVIVREGPILSIPGVPCEPRDRSSLPARERKPEWVPPRELQAALCQVVRAAFGVCPEDAARAAWELLGFSRTSAEMQARAVKGLRALVKASQIVFREGQYWAQ